MIEKRNPPARAALNEFRGSSSCAANSSVSRTDSSRDGASDLITGVERRRSFSREQKLALIDEAFGVGGSVSRGVPPGRYLLPAFFIGGGSLCWLKPTDRRLSFSR